MLNQSGFSNLAPAFNELLTMSLPHSHFRQCPHCGSHDLRKVRRYWWQRWLNLPHQYRCQDCTRRLSERQTQPQKSR